MNKDKTSGSRWIWLSVLVLFICASLSAVILIDVLGLYLADDSGAIPLIPASVMPSADGDHGAASIQTVLAGSQISQHGTASPMNPGFEAGDDNTVWTTDTHVEIFRVSYENGEQVITVNSDDGDKVIAPGTENSYTFKLKNTGGVALDYTVSVDVYFTPEDISIPITGRISRYDGQWIAGDGNTYVGVTELDGAADKATLAADKYTYYTLDWIWPFESGNDEHDTLLGNMATEKDLTLTVVIKTTAAVNDNPGSGGGISAPQTGDNVNVIVWLVLLILSFVSLTALVFAKKRKTA